MIYTGIFAGFRAARLDAQMEEGPEGTPPSSDPDGGDPHPCPEDDEFFGVPDAESQEEAINRFMEGLEQQERRGFSQIDVKSGYAGCGRHRLDTSRVKPYPQRPCGGRRLDSLCMCGMGVRFVQGHDACQMLSL